MRNLIFIFSSALFLNSCGQLQQPGTKQDKPSKAESLSSETTPTLGVSDQKFIGSCEKLTAVNQAKYGPLCLFELHSFLNFQPPVNNIASLYVDINKIKDIHKIQPDFFGVSLFFYRGVLSGNEVFIKAPHTADKSWILKEWQKKKNERVRQLFNEIYWTKKLSEAGLGPKFFGIAFMKIDDKINDVKINENSFVIITSYIEGKTYKVAEGLVPKDISDPHRKAIELILPKLKQFLLKFKIQPLDLQYMVDNNNQAFVIDPEQWRGEK